MISFGTRWHAINRDKGGYSTLNGFFLIDDIVLERFVISGRGVEGLPITTYKKSQMHQMIRGTKGPYVIVSKDFKARQ